MKNKLFVVLAAALLQALCLAGAVEAGGLAKVAESVWAYVDEPSGTPGNRFGANVGVVVGDNAVLVVDTLTSAREAERLARDIRAVTDKPVRYVVDTHAHLDHSLGNCVFADMGAVIIGHKACRERMAKHGDAVLKHGAAYGLEPGFWEGTRVVPPDIAFEKELEIDLGGLTAKVLYGGYPTHTQGNVMVMVPEKSVLFTGDILFTDFHPFLGEGDLKGWDKTLDMILAMDVKTIVPGHGPVSGKKDVQDMKDYLASFDANAGELRRELDSVEAITAEMLKRLPKRSDGAFLVGANIGMRYPPVKNAGNK